LLLALALGVASALAPVARAGVAAEAIAPRLQTGSIHERRKALDELMATAPEDAETAAALIRLLRSPDAEEARYADFMQRVGQAIQASAGKAAWPARNVELLTSVLVHNDAYDSRATSLTAATVAAVARQQQFTSKAIDDLSTVLWHRVDRNPNRARNDNTRPRVVRAFRYIRARQGLPQAVFDAGVASLATEGSVSVRREIVLLIDESARAEPASEAMVRALTQVLGADESAPVRVLAARALRGSSARQGHPAAMLGALQAAAMDPDPAVRREALAGLAAAAAVHAASPGAMAQLLQAASGDPNAQMRLQVWQALRKHYAARAPDRPTRKVLLDRLGKETDPRVRGQIALTLQEIHAQRRFEAGELEPLIPQVTDDPAAEVRRALARMLVDPPARLDLAGWQNATRRMGLSLADAVSALAAPDKAAQNDQAALRAQLHGQYAIALSAGRPPAVRREILEGLFALSLRGPLPQPVADALARSLSSDADAELRLRAAAVLLHDSLQHDRDPAVFFPALDDADARVRDYTAFALVERNAVGGEVLPGLLANARDASVHRQLRLYSIRRLALWGRAGMALPEPVQVALLELTAAPDMELRAEAWNALRQLKLPAQEWRRAADDDDLGIRRLAWRELEALGVAKPLSAKWRDPKERRELIALGLLGTTVVVVLGGAAAFFWRLLLWWQGARQRWGRMLAAQLLWLAAALAAVTLDAGIVFVAALSHHGLSVKDLTLVNNLFGAVLAGYTALAFVAWKLLPPAQSTSNTS